MFNKKIAVLSPSESSLKEVCNHADFFTEEYSHNLVESCTEYKVIFIDLRINQAPEIGKSIFAKGYNGELYYINPQPESELQERYDNVISPDEIHKYSEVNRDKRDSLPEQISNSIFLKLHLDKRAKV